MAMSREGEVDYDEPQDEGVAVLPNEDPTSRNMSDRFPGEANEEAEDARKGKLGDKAPSQEPAGTSSGAGTPATPARSLAEPKTVT